MTRSASTAETAAVLDREAVRQSGSADSFRRSRQGGGGKARSRVAARISEGDQGQLLPQQPACRIRPRQKPVGIPRSRSACWPSITRTCRSSAIADSRVITIDFSSTRPASLPPRGANTIAAEYIALQSAAMRDTNEERDAVAGVRDRRSSQRRWLRRRPRSPSSAAANDLFTSGGQTPTTLNQQPLADLNAERAEFAPPGPTQRPRRPRSRPA